MHMCSSNRQALAQQQPKTCGEHLWGCHSRNMHMCSSDRQALAAAATENPRQCHGAEATGAPPEAPARLRLRLGMVLLPRGGLPLRAHCLPGRSPARSCWACGIWVRGGAHAQGDRLSGAPAQRDQRRYGASCCHQRDARVHLSAPGPGSQAVTLRDWPLLLLGLRCVCTCVCAPRTGMACSCHAGGDVLLSREGSGCRVAAMPRKVHASHRQQNA